MASQRGVKTCPKCKQIKPRYMYHNYRGVSMCKVCYKYWDRYRYLAKKRKRIQERKQSRSEYLWSYLLGKECIDCGEQNIVTFHFDHLHSKRDIICRMIQKPSIPMQHVFEEIEKCEIVCANCHLLRTAKRSKWQKLKAYEKYLIESR